MRGGAMSKKRIAIIIFSPVLIPILLLLSPLILLFFMGDALADLILGDHE
jgi:hypothetical protein